MSLEANYPEVGDLVIATVTKVVDYGVYVKLDEYGIEGLIHISEISTTWVRNIRDHVREGQKTVLKVLRVNPQRHQVDLSLRRVSGREKAEKMLQWKREKKGEAILRTAAERLKAPGEMLTKVREAISQKYDNLYYAFEEAIEDGEDLFVKLGLDESWAKALTETARSKIKAERARVRTTVELTCLKPDGVEAIRDALISAKKVRKGRGVQVKTYALGAPKYRIEVLANDYAQAEKILDEAARQCVETLSSLGGDGKVLR